MPFTSYHFAFGLLVGLPIKRWIHLPTLLIVTTIIVDMEPIMVMLGVIEGRVHGYLHTLLLGVFMGSIAGSAMYFLERRVGFLRTLYRSLYLSHESEGLLSHILAGILGWLLHIILDSLIYSDIRPLEPFITGYNPLNISHIIPLPMLYLSYDVILFAGLSLYILYFLRSSIAEDGFTLTLFRTGILIILVSLIIAPMEFTAFAREGDVRSVLIAVAPITIVLGFLGIAVSVLSLYFLNLLSLRRSIAVLSMLSIIALLSSNRSFFALELFAILYIGIAVILILLRRSLSGLEVTIYRANVKIIDLMLISWIATILIVGVPMLIITLLLLFIKSNSLIPRDLREKIY